jgi:hypothetical protein
MRLRLHRRRGTYAPDSSAALSDLSRDPKHPWRLATPALKAARAGHSNVRTRTCTTTAAAAAQRHLSAARRRHDIARSRLSQCCTPDRVRQRSDGCKRSAARRTSTTHHESAESATATASRLGGISS